MDDMTITAKSIVEGRWMLEDLEKLFTWARMRFKPTKSRSLVIKKGKLEKNSLPNIKQDNSNNLGKTNQVLGKMV